MRTRGCRTVMARPWLAAVLLVAFAAAASVAPAAQVAPATGLPVRLTDQEFWRIVEEFSEPNGFFDSDNLVSNEDTFQSVIPELQKTIRPGGVYLGVGPDQNFTYIVATAPRLSFIPDVRRGNLHLHLMYKALLEIAQDRADFVALLFSRPRPAGLGPMTRAGDLLHAYAAVTPDRMLQGRTYRALVDRLTKVHAFKLDVDDLAGIAAVHTSFFNGGPALRFVSSRPGNSYPSYLDLQVGTDAQGINHGYLASEANFRALKAAEQENRIVPLVGNFAGPKAIRAVGAYLKAHRATVSVFYLSNVERYLFQDRLWNAFAANVGALPVDATSTFIRSCFDSCSAPSEARSVSLLDSIPGLLRDVAAGRITSYGDVLTRSHRR